MFNLFLIFQYFFAYPENVNEEISPNNKDEVETMMNAVPKLLYVVSHCDSHCLHANVQTSSIVNYLVNENRSIHNLYGSRPQTFFLKIRYREGQVDYYGKKGMSLLGITEIRWKFYGEVSGFEY